VQIHGGFDDALPGLRLLLGAALQGVSAGHSISLHKYVHPLLTVARISLYICVLSNLTYVHRPPVFFPKLILVMEEFMETKVSEIASGIYRLSTYVPDIAPPAGFTFNQFLVLGDEPLMFHTGLRKMFPLNREALSRIIPPERLRWIAYGHFEADECGAMNEWLAVAPQATPAHGQTGCMVSLTDFADREPRTLMDGEVIDIGGGKRVRFIDTPHTPPGWDAGVLFEESTRTLLCGDLFTQLGNDKALTDGDVVGPAIAAEDIFNYSSLSPGMGSTIRGLASLAPRTLALMHGPSFTGDGAAALRALADDYDRRISGQVFADAGRPAA
jgi:glyoxylase-like metal-dependent hydrolase (beta-lactamase superfamily II)